LPDPANCRNEDSPACAVISETPMIAIQPEAAADAVAIEDLLDRAFEPDRRTRPSYRLRAGQAPLGALCFVARKGERVVGTIRFWSIMTGSAPAILLGPIAVDPDEQGQRIGASLAAVGIEAARTAGHGVIVAIGTRAYLGRFGFAPARPRGLVFDTAVADDRFLVLELVSGALEGDVGPLAPGGRLRRGLSSGLLSARRAAA
jgi:predicted N-acetyltransferase YhbS